MRLLTFFSMLFLLLIIPKPSTAKDQLSYGTIRHGGLERSFFYFTPKVKHSQKMPLLLALHGGGKKDGGDYAKRTGYVPIARKEGFIVVFPNGMNAQWNDGRGKTFRGIDDNTHIDDAGFLAYLIDYFIENYQVDKTRVYLEGSSNGGMMTYRTLCEYSEKIAASAALISSMPENIFSTCAPISPVSLLSMNSIADPWVPFEGGDVEIVFGKKRKKAGKIIPTYKNIEFWAYHNGCSTRPVVKNLPDRVDDGTYIVQKSYQGCKNNTNVELYEVHGGGHSRPGMHGFVPKRLLGNKSEDIDASKVIWNFLKQHSKKI